MRELITATRTTRRVLNMGKDTLHVARHIRQANGKTRLKITGKLLALITLGLSKWFVREMWRITQKKTVVYLGKDKNGDDTYFLSKDGF